MRRAWAAAALLALLPGCAYYNSMYNANRLARAARAAEREGRPAEAQSFWGQAMVKADTMLARFPRSRWAAEAWAVKAEAALALAQCDQAQRYAGRVHSATTRTALLERAALVEGACELRAGRPDVAGDLLRPLVHSRDAELRARGAWLAARALRLAGRPAEALEALEVLPARLTRLDRLYALGDLDRTMDARALLDSLVAERDTTLGWDSVLSQAAFRSPEAGSALLDHLLERNAVVGEVAIRALVADADRLAASPARARARLVQAIGLGATASAALAARLALYRLDLAAVERPEALAPIADSLGELGSLEGEVPVAAVDLGRVLGRVRAQLDSAPPGAPLGDLRRFVAASLARDSLRAPVLAAGLFRSVAADWPSSPYAPKAILAARQLDGGRDSVGLADRYADNPYLQMMRGTGVEAFRQLEDSLARFEIAVTTAQPTAPRAGPARRPARRPEAEAPGRRQPPAGRAGVEP